MHYDLRIEREPSAILEYLGDIQAEADREREALGFLPAAAYREIVLQKKLILLLVPHDGGSSYAGHIIFGGVFPNARVQQTCVAPKYRRAGGGPLLLRALISHLESQGYLSVSARVAAELDQANAFYDRNGFSEIRRVPGGASRNRTLIIRARRLDAPSLFSEPRKTPASVGVPISVRANSAAPVYAIDLNVFYDFVRNRNRSDQATALVSAALSHDIRLVVTSEFVNELKRTTQDADNDPILAFAKKLPVLRAPDKPILAQVTRDIALIVFREKAKNGTLSKADHSDVEHIALAAAASAQGYITSDEAILRARDELFSKFGIDVIGLTEFAATLDQPSDERTSPSKVFKSISFAVSSHGPEICEFLKSHGLNGDRLSPPQTTRGLQPRYLVAKDANSIVAVSIFDQSSRPDTASQLCICAEQDHAYSSTVVDYLLDDACTHASIDHPASISLNIGAKHELTYRTALTRGFSDKDGEGKRLEKVAAGLPVTSRNWREVMRRIERLGGIRVQSDVPEFRNHECEIRVSVGLQSAYVSAVRLETLLGPTLFALPGREGVLVPIAKSFSDDLIGGGFQLSFLSDPEAAFLSRRTYFNTPRAARSMTMDAILLFYESSRTGGRGAVIAAARICDSLVTLKTQIPEALQRGAVIRDTSNLSTADRILATTFDNLILFKRPVGRAFLSKLDGVADGNFQTATSIASEQLVAILEHGCFDH